MKTKVIAFYLPQFHEIPENNKWWGSGFTEWTNVKKSKPLFKGHNQPRQPIKDFYYDLSDSDTLRWQAELMKQYNIDGLCFYHYWFSGKLLLEKPLSLLLSNTDINMPFMLSWANEPWTRAWDGQDKQVLQAQNYGGEIEWEAHFNYLLTAFKDSRYICDNGKPVIIIYRAQSIPNFDEMIDFWNNLAIKSGLPGLHIIISKTFFKDKLVLKKSYKELYFEPMYTVSNLKFSSKIYHKIKRIIKSVFLNNNILIHDYDYIWKKIVNRKEYENHYFGAFVDWDNSPRKKEKALVFTGATPSKFKKYFKIQYEKSLKNKSDYIFINAWNEWAEGTYLEPDDKNGFDYLQAIKDVKEN